ncbi:hypothetical protein ABFG93_21830 (plasmid) [Pseudalkalibacillus hwajinpoensis]|uniref:hypothetical protein n=1 Tax=Guptibacillus hwajinpoensis TaxID=208199 RepID=UPI00325A4E4B
MEKDSFEEINNPSSYHMNLPNDVEFRFKEYNTIKYELLKYPEWNVLRAMNVYKMFNMASRIKNFNEVTKSEYLFFKKQYKDAHNIYYESQKEFYNIQHEEGNNHSTT